MTCLLKKHLKVINFLEISALSRCDDIFLGEEGSSVEDFFRIVMDLCALWQNLFSYFWKIFYEEKLVCNFQKVKFFTIVGN